MELNVLARARHFSEKPFPFILIEDALPQKLYDQLESSFPEDLVCSTPVLDSGVTYRYKTNSVLGEARVPSIWRDFFEIHTSAEYFRACLKIFEPYLETNYPELLDSTAHSPISVRNIEKSAPLVTDCQFVVHEPLDETKTSRTPHLDNPCEIYAGLLYMRKNLDLSSGGNLVLHEVIQEISEVHRARGREVSAQCHQPFFEVPYKSNTFCMFLNTRSSVHSVTPRSGARLRRRSVNIIGEFNGAGRMWDIREVN